MNESFAEVEKIHETIAFDISIHINCFRFVKAKQQNKGRVKFFYNHT